MIKIWLVSSFNQHKRGSMASLCQSCYLSSLTPKFPWSWCYIFPLCDDHTWDSLHCPLQSFSFTPDPQGMHSQTLTPPYLHLCTTSVCVCVPVNEHLSVSSLLRLNCTDLSIHVLTLILSAIVYQTKLWYWYEACWYSYVLWIVVNLNMFMSVLVVNDQ